MATTGRSTDATPATDAVATLLRDAEFVHLVGRTDGDALAAAGILGTALDAIDTPYQVSLATSAADAEDRLLDGGPAIGLGLDVGSAALTSGSVALAAFETAAGLDTSTGADHEPDPILAIAGAVAGGYAPQGPALEAAKSQGVERRPGLGLPTADIGAGLAYSGWLHGSFSGDEQAAGAFLAELDLPAELDADAHTRLASAVALDVTDSDDGSVDSIERVLAPLGGPAPFETVEGYGDVLDALAMTDPGTGLSFVLGHADRSDAIDVWRDAGERLHRTLERLSVSTAGDTAAGSVEDVAPSRVARLVRDFRVSESSVLISGPDSIALATEEDDARELLGAVFDPLRVSGTSRLAVADETADPMDVTADIQEAR